MRSASSCASHIGRRPVSDGSRGSEARKGRGQERLETFKSGDFGLLGVVDQDRVIFARAPLRRQHIPLKTDSAPPVEIVAMYGGADGRLIKAAVDQGVKGIVVQALGWGNMNQPMFAAVKGCDCKRSAGRDRFAGSNRSRLAQLRIRGRRKDAG